MSGKEIKKKVKLNVCLTLDRCDGTEFVALEIATDRFRSLHCFLLDVKSYETTRGPIFLTSSQPVSMLQVYIFKCTSFKVFGKMKKNPRSF